MKGLQKGKLRLGIERSGNERLAEENIARYRKGCEEIGVAIYMAVEKLLERGKTHNSYSLAGSCTCFLNCLSRIA